MAGGVELLLSAGFEHVGDWRLEEGALSYEVRRYGNESKILYAFVADGQVKYVGKSARSLSQRMYNYKNPGPSQRTNIKNHQRMSELLKQGIPVQIYVFVEKEPLFYKGLAINLAAGLEDTLIEHLRPEWNEIGH
jgi:hypothetical protein